MGFDLKSILGLTGFLIFVYLLIKDAENANKIIGGLGKVYGDSVKVLQGRD